MPVALRILVVPMRRSSRWVIQVRPIVFSGLWVVVVAILASRLASWLSAPFSSRRRFRRVIARILRANTLLFASADRVAAEQAWEVGTSSDQLSHRTTQAAAVIQRCEPTGRGRLRHQAEWIGKRRGTRIGIGVRIDSTPQPDRITLNIASDRRIVVSEVVVMCSARRASSYRHAFSPVPSRG